MNRKVEFKEGRLNGVNLYGEDLRELLALFQKYCETFTISDERFMYDTFDEFKISVHGRVRELELEGTNPSIKVSIKGGGCWIKHLIRKLTITERDLDKADLLYLRAREFLVNHRTLRARALNGFVVSVLTFGVLAIAMLIARSPRFANHSDLIRFSGFFGALAIFILSRVVKHSNGYVTLDAKSTVSSFWTRNADKIKMLIIGAAIGIVGTVVAQYLVHLIVKPPSP
jgi:hypothetical protein